MGRYKFNKKLALWNRLAGQKLAAPVADPTTGEIVAEVGEVLTRERAQMLDALGVNEAVVEVEDLHTGVHLVKVFSNNMVDMKGFVDFDPEEAGVTEKVRFTVLRELLEQRDSEGMSEEDFKDLIRERMDDLIPKHIIVDDMMASINYLNCLAFGVGAPDDIDHLGNRRLRCVGELPVPHRLYPHGAGHPGANDHPGPGYRHPPVSHQYPPRHGGHQGVLRIVPPEPVHGPDQPPGGADP